MNVVNGLPAHALLVHFLVAFVPLTALLEIACALRPAARSGQLVWLTLILAGLSWKTLFVAATLKPSLSAAP